MYIINHSDNDIIHHTNHTSINHNQRILSDGNSPWGDTGAPQVMLWKCLLLAVGAPRVSLEQLP